MEIPIYIDGTQTGTLTIDRQGSAVVLDARLRDPGRLVRLYVYGGREAWYLGIPEPEGEELRLVRRFTGARLDGFPASPEYAGEERQLPDPDPAPAEGRHVLWMGGRPHYF